MNDTINELIEMCGHVGITVNDQVIKEFTGTNEELTYSLLEIIKLRVEGKFDDKLQVTESGDFIVNLGKPTQQGA